MKSNFLINRRTCLKGIGASLALPLLESMSWAQPDKAKPYKPPVRLGFMYMPCGGYHGLAVLAQGCGAFPVIAATGFGIAASGP